MIQEHEEKKCKDISEEGEFEENEGWDNMLNEDYGEGLIGNGRLL